MNDYEKRYFAKYMIAKFIAIPGELIITRKSLHFKAEGANSFFMRKKIMIDIHNILDVRFKKIAGLLDGFEVCSSDGNVLFALSLASENEWRELLSRIIPNDVSHEGALYFKEKRLIEVWAAHLSQKNMVKEIAVALLFVIPALTILWIIMRSLLPDSNIIAYLNSFFWIINSFWLADVICLVVFFSWKIIESPLSVFTKIWGLIYIVLGNILVITFLHYYGFAYLAGKKESKGARGAKARGQASS